MLQLDTSWVGSLLPLIKLCLDTMHRMEETLKLIEVRSAMGDQFVVEKKKKRKSVWKDIAALLEQQGFERTPEQCSSMWSSMVKKYEVETSSLLALFFTCSINLFTAFAASCVLWGPLHTMSKLCVSMNCKGLWNPSECCIMWSWNWILCGHGPPSVL